MKILSSRLFSILALISFSALGQETISAEEKAMLEFYSSEEYMTGYEQGERVGGAYGEMVGIMEGVIYGHAIYNEDGTFCLKGSPNEKVSKIAKKLRLLVKGGSEFSLGDVPSKEESLLFLRVNFGCFEK